MEVFGDKFTNKSGPKKIGDYWAVLKKMNLCQKNYSGYYLGTVWKQLGNTLTPTSGLTVLTFAAFHFFPIERGDRFRQMADLVHFTCTDIGHSDILDPEIDDKKCFNEFLEK